MITQITPILEMTVLEATLFVPDIRYLYPERRH